MFFVSFFSRFIDCFAPVFFFAALCRGTNLRLLPRARTPTYVTVVIDVLVVVYNKTWENRVVLSLHGQLVLDIRPRC